jgi:ribonuclease-3
MTSKDFSLLENRIGYSFSDKKLLTRAFIHASTDLDESYERLEFLGDAVLELVVSEYIYREKPEFAEGQMTKSRAALVNESALVTIARGLDFGNYMILGRGERHSGGADKPSILSDMVEALFGAVYLDGGFEAAKKVIHTLLADSFDTVLSGGGFKDFKTRLQEHYFKQGQSDIHYTVYKEEGPPHDKMFYVKLFIGGEEAADGKGRSKKLAEQKAARQAYMAVADKT